MQQELMTPIIKKAAEAIEKVGKEQGFIYIFDLSVGGVAFKSANSIDVLPLAKQVLGIPADKTVPTQFQQPAK